LIADSGKEKKASCQSFEILLKVFRIRPINKDMEEDNQTHAENREEGLTDQRRHLRTVFTYPVEFRLVSPKAESLTFTGNLKDISLGGAALEVEDRYGRFNMSEAENGRGVLSLSIPRENKMRVSARVEWVKKEEGTTHIKLGISFKDLDYNDLTVIEKLIGLKGKDHNMLWNLWEQYSR
jgi:hypothetical protein